MKKSIGVFVLILLALGGVSLIVIYKEEKGLDDIPKNEVRSVPNRQSGAGSNNRVKKIESVEQKEKGYNLSPRYEEVNIEKRIIKMNSFSLGKRKKIILSPKEVLERAGESNGREGDEFILRTSLDKSDWEGRSYLLVEALNSGKGLELTHEQVMQFLHGEQANWPNSSYRWISDELMTVLREDLPSRSLDDFTSIIHNTNADEAVRGYAIQHIGHLADQEVDMMDSIQLLWKVARSNDPVLKSTALVGLYQFSKLHPEVQPIDEILNYSLGLQGNSDEATNTTSRAILKTAGLINE